MGNQSAPEQWFANVLPELREQGIEFNNQFYTPDVFFAKLFNEKEFAQSIAGVIIATPPANHLKALKDLVYRFHTVHNIPNIPILLEKPVSLIGQEGEIAELAKQYPGNIIGADFANTSPALNYAIESGLVKRVGNVQAIMGRCVENFNVKKFVESIQDRNLCKLENSGGGIGFDMGTHAVGPIARVLDSLDLNLDQAEVQKCIMKRASHKSLEQGLTSSKDVTLNSSKWDPLAETYWYSHSSLDQGSGKTPIEIYTEAGKDTGTDDYSIVQINGDKGTLIISAGTETGHVNDKGEPDEERNVKTKPFVLFIPKGLSTSNQAELYTFKPGIGYEGVFDLFMRKACRKAESKDGTIIDKLVQAGVSSVDYIKRSYLKGLQSLLKAPEALTIAANQSYQEFTSKLLKTNQGLKLESYDFGKPPNPEPAHAMPNRKGQPFLASSRDLAKALADINLKTQGA